MTEQDWRKCAEPERMLKSLRGAVNGRKLRLFAVACCRRVWHLLREERSRRAVDVAERHADGLADDWQLEAARAGAGSAVEVWRGRARWTPGDRSVLQAQQAAWAAAARPARAPRLAASAAALAAAAAARKQARARVVSSWGRGLAAVPAELVPATWQVLSLPAWWVVRAEEAEARAAGDAQEAAERRQQSELLRELLGNPFRPVALDPAWLTWGGGTVARIARAIAEEGVFDQTPILADALEEAGCADERILEHLRGPGPHLRGCWALDLIVRGDALR
jgi:hypothetical protein